MDLERKELLLSSSPSYVLEMKRVEEDEEQVDRMRRKA